jgi:rod shape determining protein RodA
MGFQPSEMMKLAVPMMVAWFLADARLPPNRFQLLAGGFLIAVPMLMIAKQPDLGTALLIASSGFFVLFLAGLQWRLLAFLTALAAAGAPMIWHFMHDYQRQRVLTFLSPEKDPLGTGYHIIQSKIAIGSGGLLGKGWLNGTQSQLDFLPERSTDFIFAVLGEEFGFLGVLLLLHAAAGRQSRHDVFRLCYRQHRHGDRPAAGGRPAAADDQLRRHFDRDLDGRLRYPHVSPDTP